MHSIVFFILIHVYVCFREGKWSPQQSMLSLCMYVIVFILIHVYVCFCEGSLQQSMLIDAWTEDGQLVLYPLPIQMYTADRV
jgi:Ni,Fe-hydrogenase I cytochrome b subunit